MTLSLTVSVTDTVSHLVLLLAPPPGKFWGGVLTYHGMKKHDGSPLVTP